MSPTNACYWCMSLALLVFLALAVPYPNSPGIYYDEALQASVGIYLSQPSVNPYPSAWAVTLRGHTLPVMNNEYIGAVKGYLLGIAFYLFGCSAVVLRLTTVLIGFVGVVFTGCFTKKAFGPVAAVLSVFLIATDPSFIVLARHDWGPQTIAFTLRMSSLYCLACWWKSGGRTKYLAYGAALLGIGVYDKTNFLWFVVALAVAGLFVWVTSTQRPRLSVRSAAFGGAAFVFASAPLWIYNLSHQWLTFRRIALPGEEVSVEKLVQQFLPRTAALLSLLNGHAVDDWMFGRTVTPIFGISQTVLLPFTILAFIVIAAVCIRMKSPTLLALPLFLAVFTVEIYVTPRPVWVHHWIGLYPLPHLMIGLAGSLALRWPIDKLIPRRVAQCLVAGLFGIAVTCNIVVMRGYQRLMAEQRTSLAWSDAIYPLAASLQADHADRTVQLMDWGAYHGLNLLSAGRLHLRESYWTETGGSAPSPGYLRMLAEPTSLFVFVRSDPPQSRLLFDMAVRQAGMTVASDRKFFDHYGRAVYSVVALAPRPAPESPLGAR